MAPRTQARGPVRVGDAFEQRAREEHEARCPHAGRAAEPRQDLLGDDRLHQEQQERRKEDRRGVRQRRRKRIADYFSTDLSVLPISAGLRVVLMPHSSITASFSWAVPLPPEMMAPAWPMRLPGGAVMPALEPTTGFFMFAFTQRAAFSSSEPPISPTMITASVFGSSLNILRTSMCFNPLTGSPPMPTQVDWPRPSSVSWPTASYVSVPERETTPIGPRLWMCPGMMPILISSGVITPGQFGPTSSVRLPVILYLVRT